MRMKCTSARPADCMEEIVQTYGNMLFRICVITLGNASDAEDVVQETFIKYLQKQPEFENAEHEKAWLITVATNKCKDMLRFKSRHPVVDVNEIKELAVSNSANELTVEIKLLKFKEVPYSAFEVIGIKDYKIVDSDGKVILKGEATEPSAILDGKAEVTISVSSLLSGEYKLIVSQLEGSKKADQPLVLTGVWECEFKK